MRHYRSILLLGLLIAALSSMPLARRAPDAEARSELPPGVQMDMQDGTLHLEWTNTSANSQTQASALPDLPLVEMGGVRLPAHLLALHVSGSAAIVPQIDQLAAQPWHGALLAADQPIPQTIDGDQRPALARAQEQHLPASPLIVLREGYTRGQRIVVVALSPIFEQNGSPHLASHIQATIADAVPLPAGSDSSALLPQLSQSGPFLAAAPAPVNPLASRSDFKVTVAHSGMQRISGEMLATVGLSLPALDPGQLHLYRNGEPVPLEEQGTDDGTLAAGDEIRFYAPPPGDRWNTTDTYWLTVEASDGPRIATRNVAPATAPLRSTALEHGVWRDNTRYDSTLPGPDGDHWFAADLRSGPGQAAATITIPLTPTLPLDAGATIITISGSAYTAGPHILEAQMGADVQAATWQGTGDWTQILTFTAQSQPSLELRLLPDAAASGVALDSVAWQRPVGLRLAGKGARFAGAAGLWRYQAGGLPDNSALYDISSAANPLRLIPDSEGNTAVFQDGPLSHDYLLSGEGTLFTPTLSAHRPGSLAALAAAEVLYIAPRAFHGALAPLVARRAAQGYSVAVLDVQEIYDSWSYGQVSPAAIRDFLRYTAATWNPSPLAVTLVGDGTSDPHNYQRFNNSNFIPPYLAVVDPWLRETACDTCYVQLDGTDPLSDALPDMLLGRLPVNSADEVAALVNKILRYERVNSGGEWRSRAVYIADNYREASGEIDGAGDFAAAADASAALQPSGTIIERIYYDPSPSHVGVPWREPDAARAHQRTLDALNAGAGTVTYFGHSHHWQWGITDLNSDPAYLLGLYDPDSLSNGHRLPIVLAMTCLTSSFQQPAPLPTTIDERLVLHSSGGAVAVWGPTGLGVAYGHDALQRGFYQALWDRPSPPPALGTLTRAGYLELFTHGFCCQDTLRTFVLLGDPLTPARLLVDTPSVALPVVRR